MLFQQLGSLAFEFVNVSISGGHGLSASLIQLLFDLPLPISLIILDLIHLPVQVFDQQAQFFVVMLQLGKLIRMFIDLNIEIFFAADLLLPLSCQFIFESHDHCGLGSCRN